MTWTGLGTVHSELTELTGQVAVCPIEARVTETLSCGKMAVSIKTVAAVFFTVVSIGAVRTAHLTAISNPAGIAVRALPIDAVAEVTVFARWTLILTVLSEVTLHTRLVTSCPVPAALTRYTATVRHLTGLLAFTVATPVFAVLSV